MSCNEKSSINIKDLTVSTIISYIISNILSYIFSNILPHIYGNQILLPLPEIPFYIYGILLTPLIFLILRKCIHSKMNEGIKDQIYFATTYKPIAKMKYNNMIWIIEKDINYPQSIHVDYTPRCPKCGAELYFQKHDL